jgi:dolichol-phosphate mannosyltransferase
MKRFEPLFSRIWKFGVVGAGGVAVQVSALAFLLRLSGAHYLWATALAVELSVLFNFFWHRRWTWSERKTTCAGLTFLRFNLTNGVISLILNFFLMYLLVENVGLQPIPANVASIAICSIINFTVADRFVFL